MQDVTTSSRLEHINLTVAHPDKTAELLCELFDWQLRWSGSALDGGRTVHVGAADNGESYLALYTHKGVHNNHDKGHKTKANLNHVGVAVTDLDETERRVLDHGLKTFNHGDYEPGRRFYFYIEDDIEVEAVSYS